MILLLQPDRPRTLLPALALFRIVYYLLPLAVALVVLLVDEFYQRRHHVSRWGNAFGTLTASVAPKLLAVFTMLGGAVLMFSGATPADAGRLAGSRASCRCRCSSCRISSAASSASGCSSSRGASRAGSTPRMCSAPSALVGRASRRRC